MEAPPDFIQLADTLSALAYPSRLQILYNLRMPRSASEVRVPATQASAVAGRSRVLARQTVQSHLDKLVAQGLAVSEASDGAAQRYRVNAQRLYSASEDLHRVASLYAGGPPATDVTQVLDGERGGLDSSGPRLVLVHGLYEGRVYPLADGDTWTLGRAQQADVALDYDPYVSTVNATIRRDGSGFFIEDLKARNGTAVNWTRLPSGGRVGLSAGDVIGLGRTRLVFAT